MSKSRSEWAHAHQVPSLRAVRRRALAGSGLALLAAFGAGTAHAQTALPAGGTVVSGGATIAQGPGTVTVTQTTGKAIVNWNSFDVGATNSVTFVQPDAGSATLNRVTGTTSSTIAGRISANGAVYLVNPNGIAITASGKVSTTGGFVASTLDIADSDFNAGHLTFTGKGASAGVSNAGTITAGQGGYVALLGGSVSNSGTISVPLGKVGLGSGERIVLDVNGGGFLQVAVPTSTITGGNDALIEMAGTIATSGGRVELRAATVKDAVRNVINLSGTISADNAVGDGGTIILMGGDGGKVRTSGTLSARATGATGNGGLVETSGATVDFTGLKVDTRATSGTTGTWLVDPTDLTVDAAAAATINTNLASTNVALQTNSDGSTSGPGNTSPGNGDININSAINWTSANTLTLSAYNNINLSAAITGTSGGLTLTAGNGVAYTGAITASDAVNVRLFNLINGNWVQNSATLPAFSATDFRFTSAKANFVRVTGGNGTVGTPYTIADVYGLQGMASAYYLTNSYAIANAIDASGTGAWNNGAGFVPIGTNGAGTVLNMGGFTGNLDGGGYSVSGLTIARGGLTYVGLFGAATGSTLQNVVLTGGSVVGSTYTGFLAGALISATVIGSSASGTVGGQSAAGGLIGYISGSVTGSSASGAVTGSGTYVGGLVGRLDGTNVTSSIANSFATGTVHGQQTVGGLVGYQSASGGHQATIAGSYASGAVTNTAPGGFSAYVGGLVGYIATSGTTANTFASIDSSYATGTVSTPSTSLTSYVGGLVGAAFNNGGSTNGRITISNAYATGAVSSSGSDVGGLVGFTQSYATLSNVHATGTVTGASNIGGLVGYDNTNGTITGAYATGRVSASGVQVGGLVGQQNTATISYAYATGAVSTTTATTNSFVGGLVGYSVGAASRITNAYATGAVSSGGSYVGGLVGNLGTIGIAVSNVYATGSVTGITGIGGLVGTSSTGTSITGAYASGAVSGSGNLGGLVGLANGTTSNAYWDSYSTEQASGFGNAATGPTVTSVSSATPSGSAYQASAYGNFTVASGIGTATPAGWVFMPGNSTRPFLAFEVPTAALSGTDGSGRILVTNSHQLQLIGYDGARLSGSYALAGSIDLSDTLSGTRPGSIWSTLGFVPIGTDGAGNTWGGADFRLLANITSGIYGFTGSLYGAGSTLSNLYINRPTIKNVGLFGVSAGTLSGIKVGGKVTGSNGVGGLVGVLRQNGSITGSSSAVITTGVNLVGGLVGNQSDTTMISGSFATGKVSGTDDIGGLVGYSSGGTIARSYATGQVSGSHYVGGLVGYQYLGSVSDSYASGAVSTSIHSAGGLIGKADSTSVTNTYSTGAVSGPSVIGGLIGQGVATTVTSSYWDTQTSGQATSAGGAGRTTAQMQDPATYIGWDFTTIWSIISNDYPRLRTTP